MRSSTPMTCQLFLEELCGFGLSGRGSRARGERQLELEVESRALAGRSVDAKLAAHAAHELSTDRQPESRAGKRELAGLHTPPECVEQRRQHLGGNTASRV